MAFRLALIVTSTPGLLEIAQEGHDALVVPVRDSRGTEWPLERLINDRALLDWQRRNVYARVQTHT